MSIRTNHTQTKKKKKKEKEKKEQEVCGTVVCGTYFPKDDTHR